MRAAGVALPPLAGIPVSVKDLFDIAGDVTTAGSVLLKDAPPATDDAPAIARRRIVPPSGAAPGTAAPGTRRSLGWMDFDCAEAAEAAAASAVFDPLPTP